MSTVNNLAIQPYKGYIQETRTYLSYPFHPKRKINQKFVILCLHRSGSTLLASLLDSHPSIHCENELLYYRKMFPLRYLECRTRLSPKDNFGFKLMPNHIGYQGFQNAGQFMAELAELGYRMVNLTRRNLLRAAVSLLSAQKSGKFHYNLTERAQGLPKITLEQSEVLEKISWFQQLAELQEQITGALPHLDLVYEDHLLDSSQHQATVDQIVDYLGIPRAQVHSELAKIGTEDLSNSIANFDELAHLVQDTGLVKPSP